METEKQITLRSQTKSSGEMILYHPQENRVILQKNQRQKCSLCGSWVQTLFFDKNYFQIIQDEAFNGQFNQGYYDRFFIELQKLGRGQRGQVFLCRHVLDKVELGIFAVKAIPVGESHAWLARMLREVTLLAELKHPNIIQYKHAWLETRQLNTFGPEVPCLFILMEFANSGNVEEHIILHDTDQGNIRKQEIVRRRKRRASIALWPHTLKAQFDIDNVKMNGGIGIDQGIRKRFLTYLEINSFFLDICNGLSYLHKHNIIHRDLKPPNLLLNFENETKEGMPRILISDFGECQLINEGLHRQRTGATGTLEFMPPELLIKDTNGNYIPNNDPGADIWSLGVVLYFLCYSKVPYSQIDDLEILKQEIINFDCSKLVFEDIPRVDPIYNLLLCELLQPEASERPHVDDILIRLENNFGIDVNTGIHSPLLSEINTATLIPKPMVSHLTPDEFEDDDKSFKSIESNAAINWLPIILILLPTVPNLLCPIPNSKLVVYLVITSASTYFLFSIKRLYFGKACFFMQLGIIIHYIYHQTVCHQ
jgi:serine/threonine protein kinase